MNEDQLGDLKQFIAATISQAEKRLQDKITQLRSETAHGFSGVGEAIEAIHNQFSESETQTNKRLAKLEYQAL